MDIVVPSDLDGCESISDDIKIIEQDVVSNHGEEERTPESNILQAEVKARERYVRELHKVEELGDRALRLLEHERCSNEFKQMEPKVDSPLGSSVSTRRKGVMLLLEEIKARVHAITVGHKIESAGRMDALIDHFKICISNSIDTSNRVIADFGEQLAMDLANQQSEIMDALLGSIQEYSETHRQNQESFENLEKTVEQNILTLVQAFEDFQLDTWSANGSILQDLQTHTKRYFQSRFDTLEKTNQMRQEIASMDDTIAALSKSRDIIQSKQIKLLPAYWKKKMLLEDLMKSVQSKEHQLTRRLRHLEQGFIPPDSPSLKDIYAHKIIRHKEKEINRTLKNLQRACSSMAMHSAPVQKSILENIASSIHPITLSDSLIHEYLETLLISEQKHNHSDYSLADISQQYWESWLDQAFPSQHRQAMSTVLKEFEDLSRQPR